MNKKNKKGINLSISVVVNIILLIIVILVSLIAFVKPFREKAMSFFGTSFELESKAESLKKSIVIEINRNTLMDLFSKKYDPWLDFIVLPTDKQYKIEFSKLDEYSKKQIEAKIKLLCEYLKGHLDEREFQDCFLTNDKGEVWSCDKNKWLESEKCKFNSNTKDQTLYYLFFTKSGIYIGEFKKFKS